MSSTRFLFDEEAVIGDDHPIELVFYDKVGDTLTAEDISDRNWFYTAKNSHKDADADALIALNPADMTIDADPDLTLNPSAVTNRLTFWLPKASTSVMDAKAYAQDLQSVEIASSRVFTKGLGTLTMVGDVTDRTS